MQKDFAKLIAQLRRLGVPMTIKRNDVVQVLCPRGIVTIHGSSPSDHRALRNVIGHLRRNGVTGI